MNQSNQLNQNIQVGVYDHETSDKQIKWVQFFPNERNQVLMDVLVNIFSRLPKISKIAVGCLNLGIFHFFRNGLNDSKGSTESLGSIIDQSQIDEMGYQLAKVLSHHDQNWRVEFFYSDQSITPDFFAETPVIKELRKKYQNNY